MIECVEGVGFVISMSTPSPTPTNISFYLAYYSLSSKCWCRFV